MPIKGLTDQHSGFPRIGIIRKGAKKEENSNRPGADLTYFRAVFDEREDTAAALFAQVYGPEPREINVLLPFPDIDRNWQAWNEEHSAGALQHRCDGETCVLWRDSSGKIQRTPKPCPGGCSPVGKLRVIVPELRRLAYVEVLTTSTWDVIELTGNLEALSRMTGGKLSGIPLVLKRRPREISTPWKDGKRARRTKWLLSIEADPEWVERQIEAMKIAALPGMTAQLPAPVCDPRTGEIPMLAGELDSFELDEDLDEDLFAGGDIGDVVEGEIEDDAPEPPAGKESAPATVPASRKKLLNRYATLSSEAIALGIGADPIPDGATDAEIIEAGKLLAARVEAHREMAEQPEPVVEMDEVGPIEYDRPYSAQFVRWLARERAKWIKRDDPEWGDAVRQRDDEARPPAKQAVQRLAAAMNDAIAELGHEGEQVDLSRHSVLAYLYRRSSGHELTVLETAALSALWEGEPWKANEYARAEIAAILAARAEEQGQTSMFDGEEAP